MSPQRNKPPGRGGIVGAANVHISAVVHLSYIARPLDQLSFHGERGECDSTELKMPILKT